MRSIALRYGLIMALGFIIYFLVMHLFDLSQFYYYRIYNAFIQLACIGVAMLAYKNMRPNEFGKLTGFSMGMITSIIGVSLFALFQFLFLVLSPDFITELKEAMASISDGPEYNRAFFSGPPASKSGITTTVASYLTPFTAAIIVALEGLAAGFIISYLMMRLLLSVFK